MSSGKTAALGLNQWALSDQFLMEEFNEDNRKVDAYAQQRAFERISEVVTEQGSQQVDLNVGLINWAKYFKVSIYWQLCVDNPNKEYAYCTMRANARAGATDYRKCEMRGVADPADANNAYQGNVSPSEGRGGLRYFVTDFYPQFDGCVFYTKDISFHSSDDYYKAAIVKTAAANAVPMPLDQLKTLNFFCMTNGSTARQLSLLPGSKFIIYGVRA